MSQWRHRWERLKDLFWDRNGGDPQSYSRRMSLVDQDRARQLDLLERIFRGRVEGDLSTFAREVHEHLLWKCELDALALNLLLKSAETSELTEWARRELPPGLLRKWKKP